MTEWIIEMVAAGGYWGVAFLMVLENVIPPIPSEVIMGLGGIAVAQGKMNFWPLLIAGTVGSTAGNFAWYWVGERLGLDRLRPIIDRHGRWLTVDWHSVEQANRFFQRHGHWVVFVLRFSPLLRTMISLPAGLARMGRLRFLIYTFFGAGVWNVLLIGAGYYLGTNYEKLANYTGPVTIATAAIILIAYVWRVMTWTPRT